MRIRASVAMAAVFALTLTACSSESESSDNVRLKVGDIFAIGVPINSCGIQPMAEDDRLAEVGIELDVIPGAQLGTEHEMARQVSLGQLDMGFASGGVLAEFIPELEVFETYGLYESVDAMYEVTYGPTAVGLYDQLRDEHNMRRIGAWLYGERHILANRAIRNSQDLDGVRLRVPESPVSIAGAKAIGATPTPVAYAEIYGALDQGVVDATEAPLAVMASEGWAETKSAKYINLTNHLISHVTVLINEKKWSSLSEEQQKVLEDLTKEKETAVRECVEKNDKEALAEWKSSKTVVVVDDVDQDEMRDKARAYFSTGFTWSDTFLDLLEEIASR